MYSMLDYPITPRFTLKGVEGNENIYKWNSYFSKHSYTMRVNSETGNTTLVTERPPEVEPLVFSNIREQVFGNRDAAYNTIVTVENAALKQYLIEEGEWQDPDGKKEGRGRL